MLPNLSNLKHFIILLSGGMHSVIYSKKMRQNMMNNYKDIVFKYRDWDLNANSIKNRYVYYKSICYQLFPQTENSQYWGISNPIVYFLMSISKIIIKLHKLDKQVEPGYSILYGFSQSIIFILAIIFIYLVVTSIKKSQKK